MTDPTNRSADPKVHLGKGSGGRSHCRYSSRPSRRVRILPLEQFRQVEPAQQCKECAAKVSKS